MPLETWLLPEVFRALAAKAVMAGFGVQAFHVALFANFDGSIHINFDEVFTDKFSGFFAGRTVGTDGGAHHRAAVAGDFTSHKTDTDDVGIAVFLAEAKTFAQMRADNVPIQDGRFSAVLKQQFGQNLGGGAFARSAQTGEPQAKALFVARRN